MALTGLLATIALILTTFGLMLGIAKPAYTLRHVGAILSVVMLLTVLPAVLVNLWSAMSLRQQIRLVAVGIAVWQLRRPRRESRKSKESDSYSVTS